MDGVCESSVNLRIPLEWGPKYTIQAYLIIQSDSGLFDRWRCPFLDLAVFKGFIFLSLYHWWIAGICNWWIAWKQILLVLIWSKHHDEGTLVFIIVSEWRRNLLLHRQGQKERIKAQLQAQVWQMRQKCLDPDLLIHGGAEGHRAHPLGLGSDDHRAMELI